MLHTTFNRAFRTVFQFVSNNISDIFCIVCSQTAFFIKKQKASGDFRIIFQIIFAPFIPDLRSCFLRGYIYIYIYIYRYFYHRTLRGLQNDELPTLEPGTRSRVSVRFMAPGHKTPLARRGGAPRAGGRSPRPSGNACVDPLRLEGSPEARGVPSSGTGPSQNGTCSGGGIGRKSRAGRSTVNYFRFGWTRVCIRESVCTK